MPYNKNNAPNNKNKDMVDEPMVSDVLKEIDEDSNESKDESEYLTPKVNKFIQRILLFSSFSFLCLSLLILFRIISIGNPNPNSVSNFFFALSILATSVILYNGFLKYRTYSKFRKYRK